MIWLDATDLIVGFLVGIIWTRWYHVPVLPIKVTKLLPDPAPHKYTAWQESVAPLVRQLIVAEKFGAGVKYNPAGCKAIRQLLVTMSTKLDFALDEQFLYEKPNFKVDTEKTKTST